MLATIQRLAILIVIMWENSAIRNYKHVDLRDLIPMTRLFFF